MSQWIGLIHLLGLRACDHLSVSPKCRYNGNMNRLLILILMVLLDCTHAPAQSPELSITETTKLIQKVRKSANDPKGWAIDLLDILHSQNQPSTRENVCAAIAVIDQESNFVADPAVAGLGALAEKTLRDKMDRIPILGRVALQFLATTPSANDSYLERIRSARTERDLDMTYRSMVDDASKRANLSLVVQSGLLNQMIEERNNINTIGSMQVSVKFALENAKRQRWLPMNLTDDYALRDDLYSRHGGMYYGVLQLLGYDSGYTKKIYRFADYNAGRYASRNAAFQNLIAKLSNVKLSSDGDLLLYDKNGKPRKAISESEKALRIIFNNYQLSIDDKHLRSDLENEKESTFPATQTYIAVRDLYSRTTKQPALFAEIPNIQLNSPKIKHRMTTLSYATSVDRRYQNCMRK
jgi:Protein of unknown function (DUF1615)